MRWRCRDRILDLSERTLVMGIVNITPDSFSDGGRYFDPISAVDHAKRLIREGAGLLDLGAESTRPGAEPVPADEQIRRLKPVLEALRDSTVPVSVDTASGTVAEWALATGARVINDVTGLADPLTAQVVARSGAGVVLMHMRGRPATMQQDPRYDDAATEVRGWLKARTEEAVRAGIARECIALDPGIGFGKTARHNFELLARLEGLTALDRPVLVGVSRKSFLAGPEGLPMELRLEGSLAAAAVAVFLGARIVRAHDVAATVRAVRVADQLRAARQVENGAAT